MSADLDKAIDRAVRDLMDVEAGGDLRARVIERIERPRRALRWTWIAAPLAAVAALLLAIMLREPGETPTRPPATDIALSTPRPPAAAPQPVPDARPEAPRTALNTVSRPPDRRVSAAVATADDVNFTAPPPAQFAVVDALPSPAPIAIEQIASPPGGPPGELEIAPLRVSALEVNALPDSPHERHDEE